MTKRLALSLTLLAGVIADGKTYAPEPSYKAAHAAKVEVPPIPVCKDGSIYEPEVGCSFVDYAEPKFSCPHPYKKDKHSGQCVTATYGQSSLICPKGSYQHGKKCISEITAPVDVTCKHADAILTEDGCLRRAEPEKVVDDYMEPKLSCPKHFKLDGDICVGENSEDALLVCEDGWTLHGKKCVTIDLQPPECDKGYNYFDGRCENESIVQMDAFCPKHTEEMKGQCMQKVTEHPIAVCEKGYELSKKGKCEARVMVQAVIDDKKGAVPFQMDCKHGETDKEGNCYQIHYAPAVDVCDAGFELEKKKCVAWVPVDMEFACPKHYEQTKDGSCIKRGHGKVQCPKHYKFDDKTGMCVAELKEKAAYVCPKGTSSLKHGKHCASLEYADPMASCKHHYDLVKDVCVKPGYTKAGKDKIHKPIFSCPKGFKLDKHSEICISYMEADVDPLCEKGYEMEKKKCVAYHTVPPQGMCPKGFINEGKGCVRVSYVRPVFECPKGADDHGKKCYVYQDNQPIFAEPSGKKRI